MHCKQLVTLENWAATVTRVADQDKISAFLPADGIGLPFYGSGDFGTSPFFGST
jgi:hypothetical protein